MCGIGGVWAYRPSGVSPDEGEVRGLNEAMARRGPDGAATWWNASRRIALTHRRLAIIDLHDRSLQPMHLPEHGLTIVYNGEIYNYRELRKELETNQGFRFRTQSDTEVILALFATFGERAVERLRGMFALVIWDERRQRLFLARDPYGIKPLYFSSESGVFRFASQAKPLLRCSGVSSDLDPAGVVGFHIWGSVPEPFTLYRAISPLPAGSTMWVDAQGIQQPKRYHEIARILAEAELEHSQPVEPIVAEAVRDSVRAHLVADVEVGVFLSSGVDSGSLLALMKDVGQARVRAITLGFEELAGTDADEVPLARQIAGRYGAIHQIGMIGRSEFAASAERILEDMDQPSIDGVNTWFISSAAREAGLKVVLSGLGGDELLAGYSTFVTVPRTRRYGRMARRLPFAAALARFLVKRFAPELARRNPKVLGLLDYAESWAGAYLLRRALLLPFEVEQRIDPGTFVEGMKRLRPIQAVEAALAPEPATDIARVSALESSLYLRNQLLRDADWASMAHSLELRVPFVDWPTLCRIAPISPRLARGAGKRALASAASLPLPEVSVRRPRSGFNIPVASWIGKSPPRDRLGSRHWSGHVARAFSLN